LPHQLRLVGFCCISRRVTTCCKTSIPERNRANLLQIPVRHHLPHRIGAKYSKNIPAAKFGSLTPRSFAVAASYPSRGTQWSLIRTPTCPKVDDARVSNGRSPAPPREATARFPAVTGTLVGWTAVVMEQCHRRREKRNDISRCPTWKMKLTDW
jgi:hypothetical protein